MKVNLLKNFKYINPFYWINKRKNKEIYSIILVAKEYYITQMNQNMPIGLCYAFVHGCKQINIDILYYELELKIPKFNRKFLNAKYHNAPFWWDIIDYKSRLNAFDKLLNYYKNKI